MSALGLTPVVALGPNATAAARPTTASERIAAIDVLRGFALFGILAVNMTIFSAPLVGQILGEARGTSDLDRAAEFAIAWLAQSKFYPLFAFLFGVGSAMQMARLRAGGRAAGRFFLRRFAILMVFGMAHALLFWNGDILFIYGVLGLVSLVWRNSRPRTLLVWVLILMALPLLGNLALVGLSAGIAPVNSDNAQMDEAIRMLKDLYARTATTYATGSWGEIFVWRAIEWLIIVPFMFVTSGAQILGLVLFGHYASKQGWFTDIGKNRPVFRRMALIGFGLGLPVNVLFALAHLEGDALSGGSGLGFILLNVTGPLLSAGYIGAVVSLATRPNVVARLAPLAAAGRLNLSNYLLQSLICTTLFYGYGFGLFGKVGAASGLAIILAIWLLQIPLSVLWLRRIRYGPAEWLWRALSYGRKP